MLKQVIRDNISNHERILSALADLNGVPSAVQELNAHIKDLEAEHQQCMTQLLSPTAARRQGEYEHLHRSTTLRVFHTITGRRRAYEERESEAGRQYFEATEQKSAERRHEENLRRDLISARETHVKLLADEARYESLKKELDHLYSSIFDGPTPDFPEEDRLEYQLQSLQDQRGHIEQSLDGEGQIGKELAEAGKALSDCLTLLKEAVERVWRRDHNFRIQHNNPLDEARLLARRAEAHLREAQHLSPFVGSIGEFPTAERFLISDAYTDVTIYGRITAMITNLSFIQTNLNEEKKASRSRFETASAQLRGVSQRVEESRKELYSFRKGVFEAASRNVPPRNRSLTPPPHYQLY